VDAIQRRLTPTFVTHKQKNMGPNNILYYTDDHQVTITDAGIKVKKTLYHLNGISRHGLSVIHPPRVPFILLIVLGVGLFLSGIMNLIPGDWNIVIQIFGLSFPIVTLLMAIGAVLVLAGIFVMLKLKEKYAVHITTAEGEKNVVVSRSHQYITQIVDALNRAFLDLVKPAKK
jgi:hypothetical protein